MPENLILGLIKSYRMVVGFNGFVTDNLVFRIVELFSVQFFLPQ